MQIELQVRFSLITQDSSGIFIDMYSYTKIWRYRDILSLRDQEFFIGLTVILNSNFLSEAKKFYSCLRHDEQIISQSVPSQHSAKLFLTTTSFLLTFTVRTRQAKMWATTIFLKESWQQATWQQHARTRELFRSTEAGWPQTLAP